MSLYVPCYRPYNKHNTNSHALGRIRTHDPSKRAAADPRLRPNGHWDRLEPTIPASERPQTHALDSAATGIGNSITVDSDKDCMGFPLILAVALVWELPDLNPLR
jgi:hypothetical protein